MVDQWGRVSKDTEEPVDNLITWVFEEGTFKPAAKLTKDKAYSIITDYLGTPKEAYDWWANKVWEVELEAYGKVKSCEGWLGTPADESFIPFRFQGQYHDLETGLYYNRFRYYSPEEGMYVTAQDPIGLMGGDKLYGYVHNPNAWVDTLGLNGFTPVPFDGTSFRGIKEGQPLFSPTQRDIKHFTSTGTMPGISTFNSPSTIWATSDQFKLNITEAAVIDTKKLGPNLNAVLDSTKGHVSIMPSELYLKNNNMNMEEALKDWMKGGENHVLSQDIKKSITGTICR